VIATATSASPSPPPQLAAEQVNLDPSGLRALGGWVHQRLAQAFVFDEKGYVSHLMLPMSCQPKAIVLVTLETSCSMPAASATWRSRCIGATPDAPCPAWPLHRRNTEGA
jgi:hypothetical protein